MKKKLIILFVSSFILKLSNAQHPADGLDHFSQIGYSPQIPASPEATSLGKFGQYDVSLCYGTPDIEIPLFSIQSGDLTLPVSLSYNASGNKVKDEGSWIGLGWTLKNASMAVSRTVMGQVDEKSQDNLINDSREWWNDGSINVWDDIYKFAFNGVRDTEPDLFSYNVPGYSGQFVIGYNLRIETIPFQPVQIIPTFSSSSYGPATDLLMFIIVTPDGVSYTFNQAERSTTEITNVGGVLETKPYSEYVSSWYITSIQKGSDNITFQYFGQGLKKHPFQTSESMAFKSQYNNYVGGGSSLVTSSYNILNEWRLNKITFKGGYADVSTSGIDVVINGKPIYDINFSISLFSWRLDCTTENCRRNKLSYVSVNGNKHTFSYEDIEQPPVNCEDFDHWGFYNGANNGTKRVPYVTVNGVTYGQGANRNINPNYSKFGLLKRISYPTGGYTDFQYETNSYIELDGGGMARFEIFATDTYVKYGSNSTLQETNWPKSNMVIYDVDNTIDIGNVTWYPGLVADIEYGTVLTSGNSDENMVPAQYIKNPTFQLNFDNSNIFLTNYNTYDYRYYESSSNQEKRVKHLSTQLNLGRNYTGNIFSGTASLLSSTNAANYVKAVIQRTGYFLADPSTVSDLSIGGFRIGSISSYDNDGRLLLRKSYSYKSEVTQATSGVLLNGTKSDIQYLYPYYDNYSVLWTGPCEDADQFTNKLIIHSRPIGKLSAGLPIGYSNVTEFQEDGLGNKIGRTAYRFSLTGDQYSGEYPKAPVISMGHYRGQLLEKKIYNESNQMLVHEVNQYTHGGTADVVKGAVITKDREWLWGEVCVDFFDPSLRKYKATPYSYSEVSQGRLIKRTTTEFFSLNSIVMEEDYSYSNDNKYELLKTKSTKQGGEVIRTEFAYDYELSSDPICPSNIREERIYKNDTVIRARKINYASWDNPADIYEWRESTPDPDFSKLEEGSQDDGYEFSDEHTVSDAHITYDSPGRVRTILTRNGKPTSYFYDSDNKLMVSVIDNCPDRSNVAFASFEPGIELHNFTLELTGTAGSAPTTFFTGYGAQNLTGYILSSGALDGGKYVVEFWADGTGVTVKANASGVKTTIPISPTTYNSTWNHYRATVDISAGQMIEFIGTRIIDEVRIYPVEAQMTTYTHLPFIGILSSVDPNGVVTYFEYTSGRLIRTKDYAGNILQEFSYNYKD